MAPKPIWSCDPLGSDRNAKVLEIGQVEAIHGRLSRCTLRPMELGLESVTSLPSSPAVRRS